MTLSMQTPVRQFEKVCEIVERYNRNPAKLVPILQAVQAEYRYLPEPILSYVATSLDLPPARVFGVATFYAHFALEPKGKYIIHVCDGTACHVKGSERLLDTIRASLGLTGEQKTTPDLLFTVETVSCLGACGLAPVMVVNEKVYGQITAAACIDVIDGIKTSEGVR
ncbi:MAG TPA: NAD(P)H-dependent oxidoreductase subunit E [Acidobacteriota bacterium]|nr:NAD(P)H-dependent oxidoreductase subunit E [Acidobacteriota bacterium]